MKWFRNLNTHKKLLLTFAILILATVVVSSWGVLTAIQLRMLVLENQAQADRLEDSANAQTYFQSMVVMSRNYWLVQTRFYQDQVDRYQQQLDDYLHQAQIDAETPDEREDVETLKVLLSDHAVALDQVGNQIVDSWTITECLNISNPLPSSDLPSLPAMTAPPEGSGPPDGSPEGAIPPGSNEQPPGANPSTQESPLGGGISAGESAEMPFPGQSEGQVGEQQPPVTGFVSEDAIKQADQAANQVFAHLYNMTAKRGLKIEAINHRMMSVAIRLLILSLVSFFLLSLLVIFASQVAKQVAEPILHLTNAVISFEHHTFQPKQLSAYTRSQNELGQLARAFTGMASSIIDSLRLKDQLISAAARFVPTQYLDLLEKESIVDIELGDHVSAEMAVMFSDVRGFTTFSERMTPQQNFDFVNAYLELVSPIIQRNDGFIVKFLGDGMMAIFPYGTESAVQAGIEKQTAIQKFNQEIKAQGFPSIEIGIGIHTGHMMVGIVGEELRMQGDAFSDTVNLTSRVEGLNKFFGTSMIITAETLMRLPTPISYQMRYLGKVEVKGRQTPIDLYEVYDGEVQDVIAIKAAIKEDFERGVKAYQSGHLSKAKEYFAAVLGVAPKDKAANLYRQRVDHWSSKELPNDWEGVEVMKDK